MNRGTCFIIDIEDLCVCGDGCTGDSWVWVRDDLSQYVTEGDFKHLRLYKTLASSSSETKFDFS